MKEIVVKKTAELTTAEWDEITIGFNEEFGKDKTAAGLKQYYTANFAGYSYHGIAKDEAGKIAGFTSVIPTRYHDKKGEIFLTGLSGSTFVRKEYRSDIFVFHDIYKKLRLACLKDGCKAILGVPNKNSFKYLVKLLGFKFLYNLPYLILPVRLGNIISNPVAKALGGIYHLLLYVYIKMIRLFSLLYNPAEKGNTFDIFYPAEAFALRFNESYQTITAGSVTFTYKIFVEKNIRIAYLFDFRQNDARNWKALARAADYILSNEKIDMIAFVGKLNMKQPLLLTLPAKKEPQQLPLTIDVLVDESDPQYQQYIKPENWNFSLMNFDVR